MADAVLVEGAVGGGVFEAHLLNSHGQRSEKCEIVETKRRRS
jgi:hypothetical protein